jgi:ATPase family associated with various cellular activities (AAA)
VNVQTAIDIWLAEPGRTHELVGLTEYRHRDFGLADLLQTGGWGHGIGIGSVEAQAMPAGPDGETTQCVRCAIYLTTDPDGPAALLVRGPEEHGNSEVDVQVASTSPARGQLVIRPAPASWVLLYGPPGTGKTHTVRYLLGRLRGVTAILLSGGALGMIAEACSVARALQPSVVVVEDVDLIAEERGSRRPAGAVREIGGE